MALDIEAALVAWLSANTGWHVSTDVPNPRPNRLATVERTGGGVTSVVVDNPTVAIQCWANTRAEAAEMACIVRDMMPSFAYEAGILGVEVNSVANFPATDSPRYQLVVNIRTR